MLPSEVVPGSGADDDSRARLAYLTVWLRRWAPELESRASEADPEPEGYERFSERLAEYEQLVREHGEP